MAALDQENAMFISQTSSEVAPAPAPKCEHDDTMQVDGLAGDPLRIVRCSDCGKEGSICTLLEE